MSEWLNGPTVTVRLIRDSSINLGKVTSPGDAAKILWDTIGDSPQEHFVVIILDTRNNVLGTRVVHIGTANSAHISFRDAFLGVLECAGVALIIGHNHPSGDPSPSPEDISLSRKFKQAADIMEIKLLDSVIVGDRASNYYSLEADNQL